MDGYWSRLAKGMRPRPSMVIMLVCFALGAWGYWKAEQVRIGDTQAGVPELRPNSRYNRDTRIITSKFSIGVDILSVIVETVFAWPGTGSLLISAINARDYPLVIGTILAYTMVFVLINFVIDLIYPLVDPRIRLA